MPTQIVGKVKLALAPFRNERGTLPQELPRRVVWIVFAQAVRMTQPRPLELARFAHWVS